MRYSLDRVKLSRDNRTVDPQPHFFTIILKSASSPQF